MNSFPGLAAASFVLFAAMPPLALAADLSQYRGFKFGTGLRAMAGRLGAAASEAKVLHRRPALIQELESWPQSSQTEPAKDLVFSFCNGELYRILIKYDRYDMEGLTDEDVIDAVSLMYGPAAGLAPPARKQAEVSPLMSRSPVVCPFREADEIALARDWCKVPVA
ncbi:MAG: hypothetical protein ACE15B_20620 [Bryobacteraceae bacterium]